MDSIRSYKYLTINSILNNKPKILHSCHFIFFMNSEQFYLIARENASFE